ncbi:MAG: purine-nucleoside phosphorylase [Clostridia bacterium]|nr:purine-nucleoside phosphorylase [Clostridia bacterium]
MPTPHNEAKKGEIAKTVIMPGDPLRAKYIAEKFLSDIKIVNDVRGMYTYTGKYKGKKITVMASGMGIPSMGIYSFELFNFYDVENIIRIGTCGAMDTNIKMLDLLLVDRTFTESNYAFALDNNRCYIGESSSFLNSKIQETAKELGINIEKRNTICNEIFDPYHPKLYELIKTFPKDLHIAACEMEAFSLFYNAKRSWKNASCILTVVDTLDDLEGITPEQRESGLDIMIKLALESAIKL